MAFRVDGQVHMDPISHFLVAVLPVAAYSLGKHRRLPRGETTLVLLFATQLPDLVDKPLAWTFGLLPSGRMVAHSLVIVLPIITVIVVVAHRTGYDAYGRVFAFGYLSHLVTDFYPVLYLGTDYYFLPNMFWPILEANPDYNRTFTENAPESTGTVILTVTIVVIICIYSIYDVFRRRHRNSS